MFFGRDDFQATLELTWRNEWHPLKWRFMHPGRVLVIYFAAVFVGGALLAPGLYHAAQWAASQWKAFSGIAGEPFHRYLNRCLMVIAIVGLWPVMRGLGISSWKGIGLPRLEGRRIFSGFLWGFLSLALVAVVVTMAGAREWNTDHTGSRFVKHLVNAGLAALFVPIIEELLFRGVLFGGMRKLWDWRIALGVSSAIYALVHFMERPEPPGSVDWSTGLALLPRMLRGFGDVDALVPGFLSLTLAGVLLGLAYQRTGNLYFSMGLHGGWIFWMKSYAFLTREVPGSNTEFWGTGRVTEGWFCLAILALVLIPVAKLAPRHNASGDSPTIDVT